jgi:hypothetical protein
VGAPANHLPEGKKLPTSDCQSGRITVNRRSDSRMALCKAIPCGTTWWPACQPCAADTVVHTSYVTIAIAWCGIATGKSAMHDVRSMIAKSKPDFGKDHAPTQRPASSKSARADRRIAFSLAERIHEMRAQGLCGCAQETVLSRHERDRVPRFEIACAD